MEVLSTGAQFVQVGSGCAGAYLFVQLGRCQYSLSYGLQEVLSAMDHLLPQSLPVVTNGKHDELLVLDLLLLPMFLESDHVGVRRTPLSQLSGEFESIAGGHLFIRRKLSLLCLSCIIFILI